jgi:hypothetical protein
MIPRVLEEGVCVLEHDRDTSIVHGPSGLFRVEEDRIQWVSPYLQRSITDPTASARLCNYLQPYSVTFYSIHRTEALKRNLHLVLQHGLDWHTWGELALGSLAVIQGKARTLARLYVLREGHNGMGSVLDERQRAVDPFDWLTDTAFSSQRGTYEAFRDCLVPELVRQDGIDTNQAREVVKRAFWSYLVPQMMEKWSGRNGCETVAGWDRVREIARCVPGLRSAWRTARGTLPWRQHEISLDTLLHPASRYHDDFMPIYRAIMGGIAR